MTSYRRVTSRTLNRDVQQQDNMNIFMKPISNAVYPNYFSVPDASLNSLLVSTGSNYSATASPKLTFDGTTLDVSGHLHVSQNTDVSGNLTATGNSKVYGNLNVTGDTDVSGNLTATGNILSYGTILASQFLPGQIVNVVMLSNTDLSQIATRDISFGLTDTLITYSYTPQITNS